MATQYNLGLPKHTGPIDAELVLHTKADETATFSSADKTAVTPGHSYWVNVKFSSFDNGDHNATLAIAVFADTAAAATAAISIGNFETVTVATAATTDFYSRVGVTVPLGYGHARITATMSSGDSEALTGFTCWLEPIT